MSLVKRPNSKFWYVQFQLNHQTIVRSTRTTDRKVAEQVAAKIRAEAHSEIILGRKRVRTLEQALDRFIASKSNTANHKNLVSQKRIVLSVLPGSFALSRPLNPLLEKFRQVRVAEGCGPQTIKHGLNCIVGALGLAKKDGFDVADFECPAVKLNGGRLRYLTIEEEQRLLIELDPYREGKGLAPFVQRRAQQKTRMQDNYDLVILLLDTGARYSEIAGLRWDQIDLANKSIRLWRPKVQNESILFMTNRVFEILSRRVGSRQSEFVFSSIKGGTRLYTVEAIRKALRRAGLSDCTIHTLRHTHATRLIQNGLNVYEVRSVLGHTDIKTTMRYAHLEHVTVTSRARDVIDQLAASAEARNFDLGSLTPL